MPGLDLISPKLFPDLVSTSLAVMVTLHTVIIMMRRNMMHVLVLTLSTALLQSTLHTPASMSTRTSPLYTAWTGMVQHVMWTGTASVLLCPHVHLPRQCVGLQVAVGDVGVAGTTEEDHYGHNYLL